MRLFSLIAKLEHFTRLSDVERQALDVGDGAIRTIRAGTDISRIGDRPGPVRVIMTGWAFRYQELPDGRRQIQSLLLPGDMFGLNEQFLEEMDHSTGALTAILMAEIPH